MKKKFFLHKTLSLMLVLSMLACCTACGCGANFDETETNPATTESGINNNTATDGTMNETTTTDGIINDNAPTHTPGPVTTPGATTEQITDGTEGILQDTIDGVMDDVKRP